MKATQGKQNRLTLGMVILVPSMLTFDSLISATNELSDAALSDWWKLSKFPFGATVAAVSGTLGSKSYETPPSSPEFEGSSWTPFWWTTSTPSAGKMLIGSITHTSLQVT